MSNKESARDIDDAAARWAARVDSGPLDDETQGEMDAWLGADARRLGAYARARAVFASLDRAKALKGMPGAEARQPVSRRMLVLAGSAVAASLVGGVWIVGEQGRARFSTRLGEMRVVPLADGSVVTLNTASRIVVEFSDELRSISLLAGEAIFDIAPDRNRPFVVRAGEILVRGVESSFSVRRLGDAPAEVLVREGRVELVDRDARVVVGAHQRLVAAREAAPIAVALPEIERELAWRDGRLAFEGETLAEAAAEFARYSETKLVFEDASIGEEPVTGLFVSTDPVGFAHAVASAFGLEAETRDGEVRLRRPN
jgi:transmembrane sensor